MKSNSKHLERRLERSAKIYPARRRELSASVRFTRTLTKRFSDRGLIVRERAGRVPHDLGDIHEIFTTCSARLSVLLSGRRLTEKRILGLLYDIQRELYIHLPYHLKYLRRPLDKMIEGLEDGKLPRHKRTK